MLTVLRQRDYRLMLFGLAVSSIGTIMLYTALPFYVLVRTGSPLATGGVFMAQMLPRIVLGSIAGALVDRWKARQTMIAGDILRAASLLPLLAVRSQDTLWIVYVVMVAEACVHQFFGSSFNASLPRLVGPTNLPAANAINHVSGSIEGLIAPALGGTLLLAIGLPGIVVLDGASYLFSALLLSMISIPGAAGLDERGRSVSGLRQEWGEGVRLASRRPAIRNLLLVFGILSLAQGMMRVLLLLFANRVLRADAVQYGSLLSIGGAGALLGGLAAGWLGRWAAPTTLWTVAYAGLGLTVLAQLVTRALQPVAALMVPSSAFSNVGVISGRTLLMTTFPDRQRGRLFGVWESFTGILIIIGTATASLLAGPLGIIPTYLIAVIALLVVALVSPAALRRNTPEEG